MKNKDLVSALGATSAEPPHSIAQARVDDKGRLKLPSEFLAYLKAQKVDTVFITTLDKRLARIYPIPLWNATTNFLENAGEHAEIASHLALVAKAYGGDSEIDAQGRVLMPSELRRLLELESQPVWLDCYNGRINVASRKIHEERMQTAQANLDDKLKALEKMGLK